MESMKYVKPLRVDPGFPQKNITLPFRVSNRYLYLDDLLRVFPMVLPNALDFDVSIVIDLLKVKLVFDHLISRDHPFEVL